MSEIDNTPAASTSIVNYMLNRFMPFVSAAGLLFLVLGFGSFVPYMVLGFMWFATRFSFSCGVASAVLEHELRNLTSKAMLESFEDREVNESVETDKKEEK